MSELITTSSAYIINGDSPMTSVANTIAMTTFAVHTLQPLIFYTQRPAATFADESYGSPKNTSDQRRLLTSNYY